MQKYRDTLMVLHTGSEAILSKKINSIREIFLTFDCLQVELRDPTLFWPRTSENQGDKTGYSQATRCT